MQDETEDLRRARIAELNTGLTDDQRARRTELEAQYGQVWDTEELRREFLVVGFMAPYVVVRNLETREKGSLEFTHSPRFYFNWQVDQ